MSDDPDLSYIVPPLRKHAVPVNDVSFDPANVRKHGAKNKQAVKDSLREFGQRQVLIARKDQRTIEAGNLRLKCARELGWSHVAVIFVDDNDIEAAKFAIADNRSSELGEWSDDLGMLLDSLEDPPPGFTENDVGDVLDGLDLDDGGGTGLNLDPPDGGDGIDAEEGDPDDPESPEEFPEYDESVDTDYCCPKCGYEWSGSPN